MSKPIRVLHVLAAIDSGGVANFVMNTYRSINHEKIQYDFALSSGQKSLMDDEAESMGARLFYFDKEKSIVENLKEILINEGSFDVVHSHMFFYSGLVLREAKKYGVPVRIAHAHNAYTGKKETFTRKIYEASMRHMIRSNANVLMGCSEKACRYVFGDDCMSDERTVVMPDGIDCSRFAFDENMRNSVRTEYGLEGKFVVGHVGHFNPAKNHEKILSVFAEAAKQRENAALLLVGDGKLEDAVRAKTEELGITDRVVFAGAHKDVEKMYQAMDVFLFPSRYEGFGMAMIEAQANGLACLASDVVPQDTNADGRAIYLPLEESDAVWAEQLLSMPKRNVRKTESVKSSFDLEITTMLLSEYYLKY